MRGKQHHFLRFGIGNTDGAAAFGIKRPVHKVDAYFGSAVATRLAYRFLDSEKGRENRVSQLAACKIESRLIRDVTCDAVFSL